MVDKSGRIGPGLVDRAPSRRHAGCHTELADNRGAWEGRDAVTGPQEIQNQRGFTLAAVTIILLVLVILSTIMLPQLGNFNRLARFVVVKEGVRR
jgi:hypothetical protein